MVVALSRVARLVRQLLPYDTLLDGDADVGIVRAGVWMETSAFPSGRQKNTVQGLFGGRHTLLIFNRVQEKTTLDILWGTTNW